MVTIWAGGELDTDTELDTLTTFGDQIRDAVEKEDLTIIENQTSISTGSFYFDAVLPALSPWDPYDDYDEDWIGTRVYGVESATLTRISSLLTPGSRFPKNSSELILLRIPIGTSEEYSEDLGVVTIGHRFNASAENPKQDIQEPRNTSFQIVGIIQVEIDREILPGIRADETRFIQNLTYLGGTIRSLMDTAEKRDWWDLDLRGRLIFEVDTSSPSIILEAVDRIDKASLKIEQILRGLFLRDHGIYSSNRLRYTLWGFNAFIGSVQSLVITLGIPTVFLALGFAVFSTRITGRGREKETRLFRMRGTRGWNIFILAIIEIGVATFLAIVLGMVITFPYVAFLTKSDALLNLGDVGLVPICTLNTLMTIIILIFGSTFLLNVRGIYRLAKHAITPTQSTRRTHEPLWRLLMLDWLSLGIGILGLLILILVNLPGSQLDFTMSGIISLVGPFFPLFFLLGSILVSGRIVKPIAKRISNLLWKSRFSITGIALRELPHHTGSPTWVVVIVGMCLAVIVFSLTVPSSTIINYQESQRYALGADIIIHDVPRNASWSEYFLEEFPNLEKISSVTTREMSSPNDQMRFHFIGIELDTFSGTGYLRPDFFNGINPGMMLQLLRETSNGVLLWQRNLEAYELRTGENLFLGMERLNLTSGEIERYTAELAVVGSFVFWPCLIERAGIYWENPLHELYIVTSENYLAEIVGGLATSSRELYCQVSDDITEVANSIRGTTDFAVDSVSEAVEEYVKQPMWKIELAVVNSNVVIGLILGGATIMIFLFSQMRELWKELAVHRALGMQQKQVAGMALTQGGFVLSLSVPMGLVVGLVLGFMIMAIMRTLALLYPTQPPPPLLIVPWELMIVTTIGLIGTSLIGVIVATFLTVRQSTAAVLKVAE